MDQSEFEEKLAAESKTIKEMKRRIREMKANAIKEM